MSRLMKLVVLVAVGTVVRERLVDVLTKTTGTWVGSPQDRA